MKVDYGSSTGRHWLSINGNEIYQGNDADVWLPDEDVVRLVRAIFPDCGWAAPVEPRPEGMPDEPSPSFSAPRGRNDE